MACVDLEDCLTQCREELPLNRVRRSTGRTEGWQENLELKVRRQQELGPPCPQVTLPRDSLQEVVSPLQEGECRIYLIVTLATALTFCVLSACIVLFACFR